MVKTKCRRCGHEWEYNGQNEIWAYITCPKCHTKNKLQNLIQEQIDTTKKEKEETYNKEDRKQKDLKTTTTKKTTIRYKV